jgi:flavin reductase (DIM6/NTAB) family NADH-FMN oxidoreductase RutF
VVSPARDGLRARGRRLGGAYPSAVEITADAFRLTMGRFATGVTVVTTLDGDAAKGITVNALSSVSLDPPLLMVALDRSRFITPMVRAAGRYAVNILAADQRELADCFAGADVSPSRDAFCGAAWRPGTLGVPILDGVLAALECECVETFSAGDHDLFVGRVLALHGAAREEVEALGPILYYRRRYRGLDVSSGEAISGKPEHHAG